MRIYTIGHSNRKIDEFIELILKHGIKCIIDVRRFPVSKFEDYRKENLKKILEEKGIKYFHLASLGGFRGGYEKWMESREWKEAYERLKKIASDCRTAILCAEKIPFKCHRRYIAISLAKEKWEVIHIIDKDKVWRESFI